MASATVALGLGACGSDDEDTTPSATKTATATTQGPSFRPGPGNLKDCAQNADGTLLKLDRKADVGVIRAKVIGEVRFRPSKDIATEPVGVVGDKVFFEFLPAKQGKGGRARCVEPG